MKEKTDTFALNVLSLKENDTARQQTGRRHLQYMYSTEQTDHNM